MGWQNPCEVDRHDPEPGRGGKTLVRWIDVIWDQDGVAKPLRWIDVIWGQDGVANPL